MPEICIGSVKVISHQREEEHTIGLRSVGFTLIIENNEKLQNYHSVFEKNGREPCHF